MSDLTPRPHWIFGVPLTFKFYDHQAYHCLVPMLHHGFEIWETPLDKQSEVNLSIFDLIQICCNQKIVWTNWLIHLLEEAPINPVIPHEDSIHRKLR